MATFNDHTATINLKFFKQLGFYQMFDPNSKKMFGWNVYQLSFIVLNVITQFIICFGNCGFLFELEDTVNNFDLFMIIFCNLLIYFTVWKVAKLISNRKEILDLLEVTDFMFLKSKQCRHNIKILYKHRNRAFKFTNLYFVLWIIIMIQWLFFPIMINSFIVYKADNRRLVNIINWQYTVDVNSYNKYYVLFYVFELIIAIQIVYLLVIFDILLLSIGWAIVVQYEVLAVAFKNIGLDENFQKDNDHDVLDDYKCFKSILFDQQQLDLKLKLYFSIVKHIVLIYVANISSLIIILLNTFVMIFLSTAEPFTYSIVNLCRIGSSMFIACLQLFLYSHLFDNINLKREFINLGIYSCNWTKMDFKLKKLLLLTMQVNNANQNTATMKLSPKKLVNLQLFANVMMMSYNIVSVMVKSMNK